jgi:hypothetical protein
MTNPLFQLEDDGGPTVNIRNVPVFEKHDDRDYNCDEEWLDRCVADFHSQRALSLEAHPDAKYAMLPSITIGHTPEDPDAEEPPAVGFIDNLRRVGRYLFADFVGVARGVFDKLKENKYPYRSAEVIPRKFRLANVSLLGGRYPHFALPVMRFNSSDGFERVRYTMKNTQRHFDTAPPMGGPGPDASGGGMDMEALAQQLAPLVAKLMAEGQANAVPREETSAYRHPAAGIKRHTEHTNHTADAAEDDSARMTKDPDSADFGSDEHGKGEENFKGTKMSTGKMNFADTNAVQRHISGLEAKISDLTTANERLATSVGTLQRHNQEQLGAAKRSMLRSKCKEIAGLGYAIGGTEQIDRHVDRMMNMATEDIKSYIDDVLKTMPKVSTDGGLQRHSTIHDTIRRPGDMDENERYASENPERANQLGLDRHVLDLADVLG